MEMIVLSLNDFPLGVYTTQRRADAAALKDWKKREPMWKTHGLKFKEARSEFGSGANYVRYHYHSRAFTVDAPANL